MIETRDQFYSVPVIVDSMKSLEQFQMTRCTYFSIECDTPQERWELRGLGARIPFLLYGLSGIIIGPPKDEGDEFTNKAQIDEFFDRIEAIPGFYVDINDVWVPNRLFFGRKPTRGSVFRLAGPLFHSAFAFGSNLISSDEYLSKASELEEALRYSEKETHAFQDWQRKHIAEARETYHSNREAYLPRRETFEGE